MHFFMFWTIIDYVLYVINILMKNLLKQIKQRISKYKKKLIYGSLALLISQICFFNLWWIWNNYHVFAQETKASQDDVGKQQSEKRNNTFSFFNKAVYILIYPMIVLAWKLADNSFVYWEIFGFDAVLWHLRNIIKNLANFTLWFLFVFKIFKYLIWGQKWDDLKKLIRWLLIAWIWIQASRFIMAALIDISTILAYWIWWLPISVLKDSNNEKDFDSKYNPYILKNVIDVDVSDLDSMHIYLTNTQSWENKEWMFYISECSTFVYSGAWNSEEVILAPKMIYYKNNSWNYIPTDSNRCHIYGQVYYFSSLYNELKNFTSGEKFNSQSSRTGAQWEYEAALANTQTAVITGWSTTIANLIEQWTILEIWDAHSTWWTIWSLWTGVYSPDQKLWLDVYNERTGISWSTSKLQDILNWNSYVWVFTSLYSNLLNLKSWVITATDWWIYTKVLNSALNLWYVLAIWIPLIVVAIVFLIRIGVIWIAIAISPFIVLGACFKEIWEKIFKWKFWEYFKISNLIPIIFSPAIICFAISMSAVLVHIISNLNTAKIASESSSILWWLIVMNIGSWTIPLAKLIISVFWVAITRFIVWAAIETSKIWESGIIKSLKDLTTTALWNIPIVPIPWKEGKWTEWIWANSAFGLNGNQWILSQATNNIKTQFEGENNKALEARLDPNRIKETAQNNAKTNRVTQYLSSLGAATVNWNWLDTAMFTPNDTLGTDTVNTTFNTLESDADKEKVIEAINNLSDENKRKEFGTNVGEIKIWDNTWKFDSTKSKYEKQSNPSNPTQNGNTPTPSTT